MANMIYRGAAAPTAVTATALNKNAALTNDQIDQNFYSLNTRKVETDDSRLSDSRPASDVYSWAKAATAPTNTSGAYTFSATTDSTSSSTGAVILSGGLGVAKNIYAGGNIYATNLSGTNTGDQTLPTTLPASDVYAWAKATTKPSYALNEISSGALSATTGTFSGALSATNLSGTNTGDQTLPTTLPASDVYAWAKASVKPSYAYSEISSTPTIPTTLPASDVYAWAKASVKPSYALNEISSAALSATTGTFSSNVAITGDITASGTITSSSDSRIKTNVTKIDHALAKVEQLNGYTFDRTDIETPRQTGVIAQEVLKVLPEAVLGTEDTTYTVAYGNMIGLMIEAIKELNAKVVDLQNQLAINK